MTAADILEKVQAMAAGAGPIGNSLKFDFGDEQIHVDGTGDGNAVSTEDKEADCVIKISPKNFEKLVNGDLNPMMAVMMGKIKIKGDMGVAMKLQALLG